MNEVDRPRLRPGSLLSGTLPWVAWASATGVGVSILTAVLVLLVGNAFRDGSPLPVGWSVAVVAGAALLAGVGPPARTRAVSVLRRHAVGLIHRHILDIGPALRDRYRTGDVAGVMTDGVERVGAMVGRFLPLVVRGLAVPLVVAGMAISIDAWVGTVLLLALPLVALALRGLERSFRSAGERLRRSRDALAADFLDALQGLTTLKLFDRSREWASVLEARSEEVRGRTMGVLRVNQQALIWVDLVYSAVSVLAVLGVIWWRVSAGNLGTAGAVTLFLLAVVAIEPLVDLVSFFYLGALGIGALRRIGELGEVPPRPRGEACPDTPARGELVFEGVTFAYPGSSTPSLHDVNLTVTPGTSVALVGRSGAGKSTLASLALGLRHPHRGRVLVDGTDLLVADPAWLSRRVSYVGQDTHLFTDSVAANLRVAREDATFEDLVEVCRLANVLEVIEALPDGFETVVGERGRDLSGGEAQRIGIARAFLADAPLLILDEATSGLDLETEALVGEAIRRLMSGRSVLVIAHRITTVRGCDEVVQMEGGRIVARGAPDDMGDGLFGRMRSGT
ncbi:MAG: ABC transporter ATP-binding protein/permease [Actinomycetota bacterium]